MELNLKNPIAFFDLETTGINTATDRIVEISILKVDPGGKEDILTMRINPGIPIPKEASEIHGIYDADVEGEPSFKTVAKNLLYFLEGCDLAGIEIYRELVDFCKKSPNMTTAQLLERWHDHPARSHLQKLATWQLPGEQERLTQEFRDAVTGLELQWTEARITRMPRIVELGPEDREKLLALQRRRQELIEALQGGES